MNAHTQNLFSCDVKGLSFRCQTLKFSRQIWSFTSQQCNKHYRLHQKICTQCTYRACQGEDLSRWTSPRYFLGSPCQWGEFCWFFSNFLTALTMNSQENIVNHQNTHSTEGTSYLGGKSSKFATWNSDVWRHVKTCFACRSSRVDAINGNKPTETSVVVKNDTASIPSWCPLCVNIKTMGAFYCWKNAYFKRMQWLDLYWRWIIHLGKEQATVLCSSLSQIDDLSPV